MRRGLCRDGDAVKVQKMRKQNGNVDIMRTGHLMPTAEEALAALDELSHVEDVNLQWDESMSQLPEEPPRFLDPANIRDYMRGSGLDETLAPAIEAIARKIVETPSLCRLAWHACWRVFDSPQASPLKNWPALTKSLGQDAGAFYVLVALDLVPRLRASHGARGIPDGVTRDTCRQIWSFADNFRRARSGRIGMFQQQLSWMRNYTHAPMFRIGRLEFWLQPFRGNMTVYRNCRTHDTVALAGDRQKFTQDGFQDSGPRDSPLQPGEWLSRVVTDGNTVTGCPISPYGQCINREVTLPLDTWQAVLRSGDMILDLHIPAGGNLSLEACAHSFRNAPAFFRRHFPGPEPRAITCCSWIFSPLLEDFLPPDANLVRLLRELYLTPIPSEPDAGLWFIFFQDKFDLATAPRESRLQCAMHAYLSAGNRWRDGSMFLLLEDLPSFGAQPYRRRWSSMTAHEPPGTLHPCQPR